MSYKDGRDYLYVIWKDMNTRARTVIGELSKNGKYVFKYYEANVLEAQKKGFSLLIPFENINKVYESDELFPAFSARLPDRRRPDIQSILKRYDLDKYDQFELLRNSTGNLPTDGIEFADPIFLEDEKIIRSFYIAGTRHHEVCDSKNCELTIDLKIDQPLFLKCEPDNQFDRNAVLVLDRFENILGHIPVFFSKEVTEAINQGRKVSCVVKALHKELKKCQECIKAELIIE